MEVTSRIVRYEGVEIHVHVSHSPPFPKCSATLSLQKHDGVGGVPIHLPVPMHPAEFSSRSEAFDAAIAFGQWLIDAVTDWGERRMDG